LVGENQDESLRKHLQIFGTAFESQSMLYEDIDYVTRFRGSNKNKKFIFELIIGTELE